MKRRSRFVAPLAAAVLLVGGVGAAVVLTGFGRGDRGARVDGVPVRRGPLRISVLERANLKAANSVVLKSELEGRSTILWLLPEGTHVQAGDLVCELDAAALVEERVQQEIAVRNAEAEYVKAKQDLAIQESQNTSDVANARQALDFAEDDLEKYTAGEWPQQRAEALEAIKLAEADLALKADAYEWSQKLEAKGALTRTQLDADKLAYESADILLTQRRRALELLEQYDHPRRLRELRSAIDEAKRELERVELQAQARITEFEAHLGSAEARYALEKEKLAKIESQIEKARMRSPVDGMVIYAKEGGGRWGNDDPIREGTEVRERQEIITIPRTAGMIAEASLHESVLEKVDVGMPVVVRVDARPGREYAGMVRFKSQLPDQNSWWANPDLRVYRTQIELLDPDASLRTGMSCSVEILAEEYDDVLAIPVQSVFLDGGETVAFVVTAGKIEKRPIEVGLDNGLEVHVLAGLEEGEIVMLAQPPGVRLAPSPARRGKEPGEEGAPEAAAPVAEPPGAPREPGEPGALGENGGWEGAGRPGEEGAPGRGPGPRPAEGGPRSSVGRPPGAGSSAAPGAAPETARGAAPAAAGAAASSAPGPGGA